MDLPRRDFLKAAAVVVAGSQLDQAMLAAQPPTAGGEAVPPGPNLVEPFDYRGVRLGPSRWQEQYRSGRDYYAALPEDDILKGFREAAGLPAPGRTLGGWCERNSNTVFGQWLSGMARMYRATDDVALREKAIRLVNEFARTVRANGDCGMQHYPFDKLVCGLVDMQLYADYPEAVTLLDRITEYASRNFDRSNVPGTPALWWGRPNEWYTLGENLFRAYQVTGKAKYREFAEAWLYPQYWNRFLDTDDPADVHGLHAYSHVNTLSSAAMAYAVTGDASYLRILRNAYDHFQKRQCYATGGYGPIEHTMPNDGGLGRALDYRPDNFETVCGSWAGFKLARYLVQFTGEARYGDWIEKLLYNGVGAALPITTNGRNFYYSDYRVAGGMKIYKRETYTCCAGTYIQALADYHNIVYFRDAAGIYINLFLPSEVAWTQGDREVRLTQQTKYPEEDTTALALQLPQETPFKLRFRVPAWAGAGVTARVNGAAVAGPFQPGTWGEIDRTWGPGDRVEIRIPLEFRTQAVDEQHPRRVAMVRGPVVYVLDAFAHSQTFRLPETDTELNQWLAPDDEQADAFRMSLPGGRRVGSRIVPFYTMGEVAPYKMYFDRDALPFRIW